MKVISRQREWFFPKISPFLSDTFLLYLKVVRLQQNYSGMLSRWVFTQSSLKLQTLRQKFLLYSLKIEYNMATCERETCPIEKPHRHIKKTIHESSNSRSGNQRLQQIFLTKTERTFIHKDKANETMHNKYSSLNSTPSPQSSTLNWNTSSYYDYTGNISISQPSLAAGGQVDLSRTFTPTPRGTFSYGGSKDYLEALSETEDCFVNQRSSHWSVTNKSYGNQSVEVSPLTSPQPKRPSPFPSPIGVAVALNKISEDYSILNIRESTTEQQNSQMLPMDTESSNTPAPVTRLASHVNPQN